MNAKQAAVEIATTLAKLYLTNNRAGVAAHDAAGSATKVACDLVEREQPESVDRVSVRTQVLLKLAKDA